MRKGDIGLTDLINESSVKKSDPRIMALAHFDEFMAALALAKVKTGLKDLEVIQNYVSAIMSLISGLKADLNTAAITFIEEKTVELEKEVTIPEGFIIPGENETEAVVNFARTKCRTAEVCLTALNLQEMDGYHFINRCSKYLFLLSLKYR
ncbi:ATP:cob(I)alamin adenosyltransferase [Elusimicrobium posterum]|uniref:ATP:cob(I)alamin adenosyltransferase n=1 Tax=Elusimicrobium posterum TaxID=3116653 RepID=UPI003C76D3A8